MRYQGRYALESFRRGQDLLNAKAVDFAPLRDSEARKQLDEVVTRLNEHATAKESLDLEMAGQASLQQSLENEIKGQHLQPIAEFARGKLRGKPEFATLTQGVAKLEGQQLARVAYAIADAAKPYRADYAAAGFPSDVAEDLKTIADRLVSSIEERGNLRVRRAGSIQQMIVETKRGKDAVRMLNGVICKQFPNDTAFLASWDSARRINAKPGFARGSQTPDTSTPTTPTEAVQNSKAA